MRTCEIDGCNRRHRARGWCAMHYERWKRTGDPLVTTRNVSGIVGDDESRFWHFVERGPSCWNWTGALLANGYGTLGVGGRMKLAHRMSYELNVGRIEDGLEIDHLCRNRACVNPTHLEAVTGAVNRQRATDARTACPQGHAYTAANTYVRPDGRGRDCLICRRSRAVERQAAIRAANLAAGLTTKGTPRKHPG